MISSIKPTIGRKVWFWVGEEAPMGVILDKKQAFDATVVFVYDGGTVNLLLLDHYGSNNVVHNVALIDPSADDCHHEGGYENGYATWMPYQVGQAKKEATS